MKKLFVCLISLLSVAVCFSQTAIDHVEPPFWWIGMKTPSLQLIVHGKDIGKTKALLNYKGVAIANTTSTAPDYLFIDLSLASDTKPGTFVIEFKDNGKQVASYQYELKTREKGSAERKSFGAADMIYLIMPDRFANGDPNNDNMPEMIEHADRTNPNGRHGGDIKGITEHLDYIQKLGATTIWMTPLLENNLPAYTYHGYAITDYYKVDPRYGTNDSYRDMVTEAHSKGLKVVMDMVFNHAGTNAYWVKDLPQNDRLNQWPEFTRSNYRGGVLSDPYRSAYDDKKMSCGWFDMPMADINQRNPYMAKYLIQNSIWWIEFAGLDGIRQDTYPYSDKDFMVQWMLALKKEYPNFNVVGEAWENYPSQVAYWLDNTTNKDGFRSHLPYVFDFPLMGAIQKAFNENDGWDTGLPRLYEMLSQDFIYSDPSKLVTFADNHDLERVYEVQKNVANVKMILAFLATTRGLPLIYYGTEILSDRGSLQGDPGKRKDFPGGWQGDSINVFKSQNLSADQKDVLAYTSQLFNWRKTNKAVQGGKLTHFIPENGIYVYFRSLQNSSVIILMNNNKEMRTVKTTRFEEGLKGFATGKDVMGGSILKDLSSIDVPAKSVKIIELSK